ncbi:MAG: hypothetical protein MK213_02320, partial [Planctomycetes bacterium]|nr:hypothetical protein [Planctomycetota bacterium]
MKQPAHGFPHSIYERFHLVLLAVAAAVGGSWWVTHSLDPLYRSEVRFFLPRHVAGFSLRSEQPNFPTGPPLPTSDTGTQDSLLGLLKSGEFQTRLASQLPDHTSKQIEKQTSVTIDKFNLIAVSVWDRHAPTAARIANLHAIELEKNLTQNSQAQVGEQTRALNEAIQSQHELVIKTETERLDFLVHQKWTGDPKEMERLAEALEGAKEKLVGLLALQASLAAQKSELRDAMQGRPEFLESAFVQSDNPRASQLRDAYLAAQTELDTLLLTYQPARREVKSAELRLAHAQQAFEAEMPTIESSRTWTANELSANWEKQLSELQLEEIRVDAEILAYNNRLEELMQTQQGAPELESKLTSL